MAPPLSACRSGARRGPRLARSSPPSSTAHALATPLGRGFAGLAGWLRKAEAPPLESGANSGHAPGAGPRWAEAGGLSAAAAAGEDGGGCSPACMDGGAAAERAAAQEGHYQVSAGSRFRFGTRGTWAAGPGRPRAAPPPRRCLTSRIPRCPRPRLLRPVLARPERPA